MAYLIFKNVWLLKLQLVKKCFLTCLYRSPIQNDDKLKTFYPDITHLLNELIDFNYIWFFLRDFNVQHSKWCSTDKNNKAAFSLENITSIAGYNQVINKQNHFTNISVSCIDLIFASNTSYLTTAIAQRIYDKCRHGIIYGKLTFEINLPPPCHRKIWSYFFSL